VTIRCKEGEHLWVVSPENLEIRRWVGPWWDERLEAVFELLSVCDIGGCDAAKVRQIDEGGQEAILDFTLICDRDVFLNVLPADAEVIPIRSKAEKIA
jgi:hypothetical protein